MDTVYFQRKRGFWSLLSKKTYTWRTVPADVANELWIVMSQTAVSFAWRSARGELLLNEWDEESLRTQFPTHFAGHRSKSPSSPRSSSRTRGATAAEHSTSRTYVGFGGHVRGVLTYTYVGSQDRTPRMRGDWPESEREGHEHCKIARE